MEYPTRSPEGRPPADPGIWSAWPRRVILALILMLAASDLMVQFLVLALGGSGFAAVLVGAVLGVLLPLSWIGRRMGPAFRADLGLVVPRPGVLLAAALMAVAALLPVSQLAELSLRLFPPGEEWIRQANADIPRSGPEVALAFAAAVLVVPLVEEILFRGLIQRWVASFLGPNQAVAYAAVLFALAHLQPWLFLGLLGVGLVLGFVFRTTGSVVACAVAHALHNALSLGIMLQAGESSYEPTAVTAQEVLLILLSLAGMLAAGTYLWRTRAPGNAGTT
jgi:membrane protease YdiL (CAAX protease family)